MDSILSSKESTCPSEILETDISGLNLSHTWNLEDKMLEEMPDVKSSFTELENSEAETNNSLEPDARASSSSCEQETSSRQAANKGKKKKKPISEVLEDRMNVHVEKFLKFEREMEEKFLHIEKEKLELEREKVNLLKQLLNK
ncbi:hypothetical protein TNIN_134871 [Trichonephila inaurata madagascariensis]|uniref:Uncharacterized protein n=1 Tax=Trichonephila inaurata madagascariensis TaxID=2747483 RepID=A0A8X6K8H2_9ARAC|nr:hypothetical protein TNIN_134871 [Trichonephila inaurata madagascariensis]